MPAKLFQPIKVGDMPLKHRIAMPPLTRNRADAEHVPLSYVTDYYTQRGSIPGTLLITEATFIAPRAGGYPNVPGIWSDAQISAWKKVTDAIHTKGSFIYLQLWALGRSATPNQLLSEDPTFSYVSASDIPLSDRKDGITPRPLTVHEIQEYVQLYAAAASNAVYKAGFDGVEIHGANGYLIDQFLQDVSNHRTDEYGGSPEHRSRFALEIIAAVAESVGQKKTAIRLSPWSTFQDMRMEDPKPTFAHLVTEIRTSYPNLAYIHVVEPRPNNYPPVLNILPGSTNDFIREIWQSGDGETDRRLISAGGHTPESGIEWADTKGDIIAYGRSFISNPDLPFRILNNIPLTNSERKYYYTPGTKGYTDYPFATHDIKRR